MQLTAEIGLWGYEPTPADPFVLNHRNFPSATMLGDAAMVLETLVGGAGTTTIGCLGGAQVDRHGNVNSTLIPDGPFLVGSGGGNDVASVAAEVVVVATLTPAAHARPSAATSPRRDGRCARSSPTSARSRSRRRRRARAHRGAGGSGAASRTASSGRGPRAAGTLAVAREVEELPAPTADEIAALRGWDPPRLVPPRARPGTGGRRLRSAPRMAAVVAFEHVTKRFGDVTAVDDLTLEVADEEFLVLLGPSGCGKSTALRMIAGLEDPTEGTITIGDRVVNDVEAKDRDIAMVFQSYALYPHMTVRKNIEFPLRIAQGARGASATQLVARGGREPRARRACSTASPRSSRAASASGSRWPGRSCAGPRRS